MAPGYRRRLQNIIPEFQIKYIPASSGPTMRLMMVMHQGPCHREARRGGPVAFKRGNFHENVMVIKKTYTVVFIE